MPGKHIPSRRRGARRRPNEVLCEHAPDRSWFHKTRKRHVVGHLDALRLAFCEQGVAAAREMGLLDVDKPNGLKDRTRYVVADSKVIAARTNAAPGSSVAIEVVNPKTGEVRVVKRPVRYEPDAKLHTTGDTRVVNGVKLWHADVQGDETHRHAIIAIDHVPDLKGGRNAENHIMMRNFRVLAQLAPGIVGAITDGISNGQELEEIQRDLDWVPIAPVDAKKLDKVTGERLEETTKPLNVIDIAGCDAGPVELWYYEGRVVKRQVVDDGRLVLVELSWKGTRQQRTRTAPTVATSTTRSSAIAASTGWSTRSGISNEEDTGASAIAPRTSGRCRTQARSSRTSRACAAPSKAGTVASRTTCRSGAPAATGRPTSCSSCSATPSG
jgi:hypothetical protein